MYKFQLVIIEVAGIVNILHSLYRIFTKFFQNIQYIYDEYLQEF